METCVFCKITAGQEKSWKVFENDFVFAFLDIHPASKYHTLVISKTHYETIFGIPESDLIEVMKAVQKLSHHYKEKLGITDVQIIHSSGREAQQEVPHLHFHIVPRSLGDGQDVVWHTHPELTSEYDELVKEIGTI